MASIDQNSNAVLQGLARHINCLGEDNKMARRKALESIRKDTVGRKPPLDWKEMKPILNELLKPLLKMFSDPMEKCREISVDVLDSFLNAVGTPEDYLPYVMPVLVQRLGQQEIIEPSEEIRLALVNFLQNILEISGKNNGMYVDDIVKILQKTIVDPYAEVKKVSCKCATTVAKAVPEYFHQQSESLIKPLLMSISHQHSKVRSTVIYSIGDVIQYGNGKSVETVVSHLAQRLFDQTPAVRMAVTKIVGQWMLDLADRYSFWNKLIPLLLTSLSDEQPDIREVADSLWHDVGLKWERENEEDLKDKMDFPKQPSSHYPKNVERPNLGCRTLMNRNMSRFLPGLMRDITDWQVETRRKSAALLYHILLNSEDYITQHMEVVTSGMFRACADEDKQVVQDVQRSAELIGYFVDIEVWTKLVLKSVTLTQSYPSIMVLSAIIKGTEQSILKPYIQPILDTVNIPDVCHSVQIPVQLQLINCLESLIAVSDKDIVESSQSSQSVFSLLHTILALQQGEIITGKVYTLLDKLSQLEGLESRKDLYKQHTKPLLASFEDSFTIWGTHSTERLVFDVVVLESGSFVGEMLDEVMPILVANFNPEKDPEVRLKFFSLLSNLVMNSKATVDSSDKFSDFVEIVLRDMIIPNCVWKAGRVAGAIRTTAVSCAWALLQSGALTKERLAPCLDSFVTQMLTCMDDDNKGTRLVACRVMTRTLELSGTSIDQDRLHNMYLELLKRLDDSSDEIRITVSKTFLAYLDSFESAYDVNLYRAHLEAMYKGLLVHLDDPEEKIQVAILGVLKKADSLIPGMMIQEVETAKHMVRTGVLKKAGSLMPGMMIQEVETAKHKHRSKRFCDELVDYLGQLSTKAS